MDSAAFALTVRRAEAEGKASKGPSAATSIIKYAAAKLNQERTELTVEALGLQGLGWEGEGFSAGEVGAPAFDAAGQGQLDRGRHQRDQSSPTAHREAETAKAHRG